jgi:hypothetical protein
MWSETAPSIIAAVEMQGQAQEAASTPHVVQPAPATVDASQIQYIRLADGTFQAVAPQQILSASAVHNLQLQQAQPQPQQPPPQPQPPLATTQQVRPRPVVPVAMQGASGVAVSMPQVQPQQGESLVQVQPAGQAPFAATGTQRQRQVPGGAVGAQPAQPPPQLQPPTQLMRPPGPTPPQIQPYRTQQEGGTAQGPPGPVASPAHAHETLYVDDIPLDMSKRELSHIFRPFGGYKVFFLSLSAADFALFHRFVSPEKQTSHGDPMPEHRGLVVCVHMRRSDDVLIR